MKHRRLDKKIASILRKSNPWELRDGARIAVVGGGPAGTFFSIFALKYARNTGKNIHVTIFDPKDFTLPWRRGCNHCGGVIAELLLQSLALEGINLPQDVVQKGISTYELHTSLGSMTIAAPTREKCIAAVDRCGGPPNASGGLRNFDQFLLSLAVDSGAIHRSVKIDKLVRIDGGIRLYSEGQSVEDADLVVGAHGVNGNGAEMFESLGIGHKRPRTEQTGICEVHFPDGSVPDSFNDKIHLFLLPDRRVKMAAIIPKETHLTVCAMGREVDAATAKNLLEHPVIRKILPAEEQRRIACSCNTLINVGSAKRPFADRLVLCGDAGATSLYKDGIGAAYLSGKYAAETAILRGVGRKDFRRGYYPLYRKTKVDNTFGKYLYWILGLYRSVRMMTASMLGVLRMEQSTPEHRKTFSTILWDTFTGSEDYVAIVKRALSFKMHIEVWSEAVRNAVKRATG